MQLQKEAREVAHGSLVGGCKDFEVAQVSMRRKICTTAL